MDSALRRVIIYLFTNSDVKAFCCYKPHSSTKKIEFHLQLTAEEVFWHLLFLESNQNFLATTEERLY